MEVCWSGSQALDVIRRMISHSPKPEAGTETARRCAEAIGLHLTMLILVASDANTAGCHSSALALFRPMEDALDCFAAVSLIAGAADRWATGNLKASEAAALWEPRLGQVRLPTGEEIADYRKRNRTYLNNFAHCSPFLTDWNFYAELNPNDHLKVALQPHREHRLTIRIAANHQHGVLEQNAIRIGGFLAAHTVEFIRVLRMAYEGFLEGKPDLAQELDGLEDDIEEVLRSDLGGVFLEDRPPELQQFILKHPTDPNLVMPFPLSHRDKGEEDGTSDHDLEEPEIQEGAGDNS